jgi:putative membrane protein
MDLPDITSCIKRDELAFERTRLAYERTFLAYIRTAVASGVAGITLIHFFKDGPFLTIMSYTLLIGGFVLFFWGIFRYTQIRALNRLK